MHLPIVSLTGMPGGKRLGVDSSFFNWCLISFSVSVSWHSCGAGVDTIATSGVVLDISCDFLFGVTVMFLPCRNRTEDVEAKGVHVPVNKVYV